MKIALCHSMQFAEKAKEVQEALARMGHQAFPSSFNEQYLRLSDEAKENLKLQHKNNDDAIREHWNVIRDCDAVLVLNYDKNGIKGYIGGNSFLEMGFAYIQSKPIYLLNDIPEISFYDTEIKAMKPIVIYGELKKIVEDQNEKLHSGKN
ncbi:MAG: hypothetical protein A3I05_06095 [Deltaproteobacteria bacterium RIFCSPLOWO2_02_FULL_44_10]|nr:MAG: hypothetical protein A3C46_04010 [Deltaproteobacteria bacterium RIFCSPHIGHO2_02_FULL_44_16]OGQ45687.1 MAG: hypothetical protein A3I05_06095 [Deltaproteobacteria bacterium RIFCSPLOWO2_02_FULL_44_10]